MKVNLIRGTGADPLKTITMVQFRRDAEKVLKLVRRGQRVLLTYRGKPAVMMGPAEEASTFAEDDPFYRLDRLAEPAGGTLTNRDIDKLIYGE